MMGGVYYSKRSQLVPKDLIGETLETYGLKGTVLRCLNWSRRTSLVRPPFFGLGSIRCHKRFSNSHIREIAKNCHVRIAPQPATVLKKMHRRGFPVTLFKHVRHGANCLFTRVTVCYTRHIPRRQLRRSGAPDHRTTRSHAGDCRLCSRHPNDSRRPPDHEIRDFSHHSSTTITGAQFSCPRCQLKRRRTPRSSTGKTSN